MADIFGTSDKRYPISGLVNVAMVSRLLLYLVTRSD
jgi:hypothetical protein